MCVCVCCIVPNAKHLSPGSFYWPCSKLPDCEQLSPLKICAARSVTPPHSSSQTPQLQPGDALKVQEELRNALTGRLPSIATSTIGSERPAEREREGRSSVCLQTKPGGRRVGGGGSVGGGDMWHHSESRGLRHGTFWLPDHNQMGQVCPNRNDCVKAIFSNLSDSEGRSPPRAAPPPFPPHPRPPSSTPLERQKQTLEGHDNHFQQAHRESCDERYTVQRLSAAGQDGACCIDK